jgi:uncharacterized protein (TIGR02217 family)
MSDAVFPSLSGLTWPVLKTPRFSTLIQTGADMSELRATFTDQPVYDITLTYDLLRSGAQAEFQSLCGFFEARAGAFDNFLFTDATDSQVSNQVFGIGTGAEANFQLIRSLGTGNAVVKNLNGAPTITVNNVTNSSYTITNGLVTFNSPPTGNAVLRWTGSYYYRCRFAQDEVEFEQFMRLFWQAGQIKLRGALGLQV